MENSFTKRVFDIIEALKDKRLIKSDRQFAMKIKLKSSQLSLARSGEREIPIKYASIIEETFAISKHFLQTGEGKMFTYENIYEQVSKQSGNVIPQQNWKSSTVEYNVAKKIPELNTRDVVEVIEKGNYMVFEILGNDINDGLIRSIGAGDIILMKL